MKEMDVPHLKLRRNWHKQYTESLFPPPLSTSNPQILQNDRFLKKSLTALENKKGFPWWNIHHEKFLKDIVRVIQNKTGQERTVTDCVHGTGKLKVGGQIQEQDGIQGQQSSGLLLSSDIMGEVAKQDNREFPYNFQRKPLSTGRSSEYGSQARVAGQCPEGSETSSVL